MEPICGPRLASSSISALQPLVILLFVFTVLLTACGGGASSDSASSPTTTGSTGSGGSGGGTSDATSPTITINSPVSASSYTTTSGTLNISGVASDNVGVTQVACANT